MPWTRWDRNIIALAFRKATHSVWDTCETSHSALEQVAEKADCGSDSLDERDEATVDGV